MKCEKCGTKIKGKDSYRYEKKVFLQFYFCPKCKKPVEGLL